MFLVPDQLIYSLKSQAQLFQLVVAKVTIELAFHDLLKGSRIHFTTLYFSCLHRFHIHP